MYETINTRQTPQRQKARADQIENRSGGFVFQASDLMRLRRFLSIGSDAPTYYVGAQELTTDNAAVVFRMAETDPMTLINEIVAVSVGGRAPKQNPAIFALAIACSFGATEDRQRALGHVADICRTGTHLFLFAKYVEQFRGWGRGLRRAMANWYLDKHSNDVAFQAVKYRQREGWSHRDVLRLAHPKSEYGEMKAAFEWITKGNVGDETPMIIKDFLWAQVNGTDKRMPDQILASNLTWEMLPDEALQRPEVWAALLDKGMPATALMRQLPRLTNLGLLPAMGGSGYTHKVAKQLSDPERLKKARVHPINVLVAQRTYASGHSDRGSSTWSPTRQIVDALDAGFYAAFGAVEPANKRTLLCLDVSGSMAMGRIANMPLTPREASAALALVQMATEADCGVVGFTSGTGQRAFRRDQSALTPLSISPRQRLDDVIRTVSGLPFGGTDCSLPMKTATQENWAIDTFVLYTDNETWAGPDIHPHQALEQYRQKSGIDAKLVVVSMTPDKFSIADPDDPGMLDIAGFDSATPSLINSFSRGDI